MVSSTRQAIACIFAIFSVAVAANAQITPVKEPGATITGKVTLKGKGLPGVVVVLRPKNQSRSGRDYSGPKGVSDEEGNYRILNVPPGNYGILPVARAFVRGEEEEKERLLIVNKNETIEHVDFTLVRGGVITGKIVDAEGRPVVEESVYLARATDNQPVYPPYNCSTDDRGVYRVYGVPPGSYKVAAGRGEETFQSGLPRPYKRTYHPSVDDPAQATVVEVSEGAEIKDVDITFTRTVSTYSATGRVVEAETGQPLANINYGITRYREGGSHSMGGGWVTNNRGEFKLGNLSPGKYSVDISLTPESDLRAEQLRFEIVDQDVVDLVIKAAKSASISGVVVFEGADEKTVREQLNGTWISASIEGSPRAGGASARIAENGTFHIKGLTGGTANLYVFSNTMGIQIERVERDGVIQPKGIVLREREHITGIRIVTQLGNATLRGKIEVENGTAPPDGRFYVWVRRIGEDSMVMYSGANMGPQVDQRGQFIIEGMTPGTYEVVAGMYLGSTKMNYVSKRQQIVVTAGTTTNVNVTVDLNSTPIKQP